MITLIVVAVIVLIVLFRPTNLATRYSKCGHCKHAYWKHSGPDERCEATYKARRSCNCPRWEKSAQRTQVHRI